MGTREDMLRALEERRRQEAEVPLPVQVAQQRAARPPGGPAFADVAEARAAAQQQLAAATASTDMAAGLDTLQPTPPPSPAAGAYTRAGEAYQAGRFQEAADGFDKANTLEPSEAAATMMGRARGQIAPTAPTEGTPADERRFARAEQRFEREHPIMAGRDAAGEPETAFVPPSDEERAALAGPPRNPSTWVGGQNIPQRQVGETVSGDAGALAPWDASSASGPQELPTPAEAHRAELAPDQERIVAGGTPDAAQRAPSGSDARVEFERQKYREAMEATQSNRRKNKIIAMIASLLGARSSDVQNMLSGSDQPMQDFQAWSQHERGLRDDASAQQRIGDQRTRDEQRLAMDQERLDLARSAQESRSTQADRTLSLREQESAQRMSAAESDAEASARMRDPGSDVAGAYREQILAEAHRRGVEVDPNQLTNMTAEEMDEAYGGTLLRSLGHRRAGRRGGRGGRGGSEQSQAQLRDLYTQQLTRRGVDASEAAQRASVLTTAQLRNEVARGGRGTGRGAANFQGGGPSPIPGWEPTAETPGLSAPELRSLRQASATQRALGSHIARMVQLSEEISSAERAGNRAVVTERMEDARATHEMITNALREIGGYGVPQEAELARMEALAPRLNSVDGLVNATRAYRGMDTALGRHMDQFMSGYGFVRGQGRRSGGQPRSTSGQYIVTNPNTGQRRRVSAEAARAIAERAGVPLSDIAQEIR